MTENPHASIPRYPLEWPLGWRRSRSRRAATFSKEKRAINTVDATARLEDQLVRLGAELPVLSTNVSLNLRGVPRGDENPGDPGVAVYFMFKGRATVLACDTFFRVADNIAGIAAHVEALRRIDRYGVGTIEQALAGYKSLPADTAADWRQVFGLPKHGPVSRDELDSRYKQLARERHPDLGGTDDAMFHLNRARDYALSDLAAS